MRVLHVFAFRIMFMILPLLRVLAHTCSGRRQINFVGPTQVPPSLSGLSDIGALGDRMRIKGRLSPTRGLLVRGRLKCTLGW